MRARSARTLLCHDSFDAVMMMMIMIMALMMVMTTMLLNHLSHPLRRAMNTSKGSTISMHTDRVLSGGGDDVLPGQVISPENKDGKSKGL